MKTGTLELTRRMHCPYCEGSDDADEVGQFEDFDLIGCDDSGSEQIWKCLTCEETFKIYFE